jgi:hypothetical protein
LLVTEPWTRDNTKQIENWSVYGIARFGANASTTQYKNGELCEQTYKGENKMGRKVSDAAVTTGTWRLSCLMRSTSDLEAAMWFSDAQEKGYFIGNIFSLHEVTVTLRGIVDEMSVYSDIPSTYTVDNVGAKPPGNEEPRVTAM